MTKKKVGSKLKAQSALGPIAHALIQDYLGPYQRVIDMERFFTALRQALHDAYARGWRDRGEIERAKGLTCRRGELFAYADVLEMMKVLWDELSRDQARVAEAAFAH